MRDLSTAGAVVSTGSTTRGTTWLRGVEMKTCWTTWSGGRSCSSSPWWPRCSPGSAGTRPRTRTEGRPGVHRRPDEPLSVRAGGLLRSHSLPRGGRRGRPADQTLRRRRGHARGGVQRRRTHPRRRGRVRRPLRARERRLRAPDPVPQPRAAAASTGSRCSAAPPSRTPATPGTTPRTASRTGRRSASPPRRRSPSAAPT